MACSAFLVVPQRRQNHAFSRASSSNRIRVYSILHKCFYYNNYQRASIFLDVLKGSHTSSPTTSDGTVEAKNQKITTKNAMSQEEDLDALGFLDDFASESQLSQLNDNDSSNNISSLDSLLNEVEAQLATRTKTTTAEKKEKYDFDEGDSEDEEGKIQELPEHACAYCNIFDAECVVKCLDCEEKGCAKWFCNGRP